MKNLAVKVDVDTLRGYREGVPRLLSLFERRKIKASIFFSFGPDNSGKAIRRIFRRGFISKMFRTKAPSTYGIKTLMYGTLLPAPMIAASAPEIFAQAVSAGHDCGVHAWDHVYVQDKLKKISEEEFESLYGRAAEMFHDICGIKPSSYAAPGWQVTPESLSAEDKLGLAYASDTRGKYPFYPVLGGRKYATLQIPTTMPTMDEIMGMHGVTDRTLPGIWMETASNEWNVLTVHAEMEGISKLAPLEKFLRLAEDEGFRIMTLAEISKEAKAVPCGITNGYVAGRAGTLAMQTEGN